MLDPAVLAKLGSVQLRARAVVEGLLSGLHRSPHQGQSVEVRSGDGTSSYTLDVTVHDSAPDTLNATISFTEGSSYRLPPTLLLWKKGQTCIIRVPSVVFAQPPRTLIIDVLLPGEDPGC